MTNNEDTKVYKSFEQLKAELFPVMTESEKKEKTKNDSEQFGVRMADKEIEQLLPNI